MRPFHIAIRIILGAALLFNQVGLALLHDRHDAHEFHIAAQKNQTVLLNHGEHCQVCSLEVLFNVVLPESTELRLAFRNPVFNAAWSEQPVHSAASLRPGRAPPTVS